MKGTANNLDELTRLEAYLLSEKAGHPSHMHDYFWTQAEAMVRQRVAIVPIAVKKPAVSASKKPVATPAKPGKTAPAVTGPGGKPSAAKARTPPKSK